MYEAIVCKLKNLRPHPNANKLQLMTFQGYQVVLGLDNTEGQLGVFFPVGGKLSQEYLHNNNLFKHSELNIDKTKAGFFSDNGRVRSIKLRGEKSDGFWMPIESLDWAGPNRLKEGDTFDRVGQHVICEKYITRATRNQMSQGQSKKKKAKEGFKMLIQHYDTPQLRNNVKRIPHNSVLYITEKLHGCVSGDTMVNTLEYGNVKISHIVNNIPNIDIHILGVDISSGQRKFSKVSDRYLKRNHGEWYKIITEDGTELEITGNNPVWLPELKCYRRVDELKEGDIVLIDK